ncbi:MAG: alpha/beta hydrolase [Sulfuricurvum sp.]|nr:alpha/beta hydrolase [Sulfuricurvum sp.]
MKKVLILHGWHGSDLPHWQGWLAQELAVENCIVAFPQFSDNLRPDKEVWVREALDALDDLRPDVVVCHSLANILWFHLCSRRNFRVKKLLLCSPPRDLGEYPEVATFFPAPLPESLRTEEALMVVSDNDPYMSLRESESLAESLGVALHVLHDAGHINTAAGFGPWPWVKEWVLS